MPVQHREKQPHSQPVYIGGWKLDEDFPVFPVGSKPKRLVVCPADATEPFLVPGHRYLFKVAEGWQTYQSWSEVVAYELARPIGLEVPPCFIAVDESTGEMGVLVEFFYGYPDDPAPPRFVHGSDILQRLLPHQKYDQKSGRPHTVRTNLTVCRALQIKDATGWWGKTFAFDAMIGNTDRHPENWGFLLRIAGLPEVETSMSPVFDNGTSLGYEHTNEALTQVWDTRRLSAYVKRGTHHCQWTIEEQKGRPHIGLCDEFCKTYSTASAAMKNVILLTDSQIEEVTNWCTLFDVPVPFVSERAQFVSQLVKARRDQLAQALGA